MPSPLRPSQEITLTISHLGGLGDGVGEVAGAQIFIPLTAPGDVALARVQSTGTPVRGEMLELLEPSPLRQFPPCPHFGECGGCSLQHLNDETYTQFKFRQIQALARRLTGNHDVVQSLFSVGPHARRRADFALSSRKGVVQIGFRALRSHALVDLSTCFISEPTIVSLLASLRSLLGSLKKPGLLTSLHISQLSRDAAEGVDMLLVGTQSLPAPDVQALKNYCQNAPWMRLHLQVGDEVPRCLSPRRTMELMLGQVAVELPPGAFLQASISGQEALTAAVLRHAEPCRVVADIFSGCGTYSFPLLAAPDRDVHAYEGNMEMVTAMHNAIQRHGLHNRASAEMRDLYRNPLSAEELRRYDAVVINPPRNGALPQVLEIAKAKVKRVIMVSCNPATFERDAKALLDTGYALREILPIDQFFWSAHQELVACFDLTV